MAPPTGISAEHLLEFGASLPETALKEYAGSTAVTFRGRGILYVGHDDPIAMVKATIADREALVGAAPDVFWPRHTSGRFGWVGVRLDLVDPQEMREIVTDAWRHSAPRRLVAELDGD
jgi:hypothetical protein